MRLKSFYAKTMTEAMQMVREALGEDAIIVATREENGGRAVRVTAALEDAPAFELADTADDGGWLQYDEEDLEAAVNEELTEAMLKHSVPEDVTDQILSCATVMGLEQPRVALIAAVEHLFGFQPLPSGPSRKAFMLVGPPGAGKTLATAKLTARAIFQDMNAAVVSTDTQRAGGMEQLQAFLRIMKVNLSKAANRSDLEDALARAADAQAEQVFIDTPGINPFAPDEVRTLARMIETGRIEPVLVMPAGADATESGEIARVFASIGVQRMLCTRLDVARRIGGLLEAAHQGGLSFAELSANPQVADGLQTPSPKVICDYLMPSQRRKRQDDQGTGRTTR